MRYLAIVISFVCTPLISAQAADLRLTAKACPAYIGACEINVYTVKAGDTCQSFMSRKNFFHFSSLAQIQQLNPDVKCPTRGLKVGATLCYPKKPC